MLSSEQMRFWLIELIAWWEGGVNTRHLTRYFNISRQQASKDFKTYQGTLAPSNLTYNNSQKVYQPSASFIRLFISGDVVEYLNWATGITSNSVFGIGELGMPHEYVALPPRRVAPTVMRPIVEAVRKQKRLEVDYVSLTNPNREGRIIAPHTFVNTGLRWHLRAWCEKSQEYRDFVLSRFRGKPEIQGKTTQTVDKDLAWNTHITLIIQPDPRLSEPKRQVIERDYQMECGQLTVVTRAALATYLLHEMQINTKFLDATPEAQQLILVNRDDVKQWLF